MRDGDNIDLSGTINSNASGGIHYQPLMPGSLKSKASKIVLRYPDFKGMITKSRNENGDSSVKSGVSAFSLKKTLDQIQIRQLLDKSQNADAN